MKKALLIGGTGTISAAVCARLLRLGWEVNVLNRGLAREKHIPHEFDLRAARLIKADINDEDAVSRLIAADYYDCVVDFIAFTTNAVERDFRLFNGKTAQYIFISSASAYQKPIASPYITESTPLANPYWQYSRDKIACEELLMKLYREEGFPITIVRPSHTYDQRSIPLAIHGNSGSWQTIKRITEGKPVLLHGDGTSLWTFTHSRDFAKGFTGLMGNIHAIGQPVHITSDESLTWNQAVFSIARALGRPARVIHVPSEILIREGKAFGYDFYGPLLGDKACPVIFNNSKIKSLVPDFCAQTRYDEGVSESIEWHLQNPVMQKPDDEFDSFCEHFENGSFELESVYI